MEPKVSTMRFRSRCITPTARIALGNGECVVKPVAQRQIVKLLGGHGRAERDHAIKHTAQIAEWRDCRAMGRVLQLRPPTAKRLPPPRPAPRSAHTNSTVQSGPATFHAPEQLAVNKSGPPVRGWWRWWRKQRMLKNLRRR